jgi:16S rRNA (uracil1498-N3)-methyltransferase
MGHDRDNSRRFFVDGLPAEAGAIVPLSPGEAHHAVHVLRLRAGAEVELFDGRGRRAEGVIARAGRSEAAAEVRRMLPPSPRPQPQVHLGFAVPKGKRLDWLLEKATELGAASLTPVRFERSVAGPAPLARRGRSPAAQDPAAQRAAAQSPAARERWLGHCIAAAKQCGLDFLPVIEDAAGLSEFLARQGGGAASEGRVQAADRLHTLPPPLACGRLCLLGDAGPAAVPLKDALAGWQAGREVCLLVGPEGGLTEAERAEALAAGCLPARLGATTLRIETAAVALLAAAIAICLEG